MLVDQLAGAFGLGGRPRIAGDPSRAGAHGRHDADPCRDHTIGRQDEALGRHLP